MFTIKGKTGDWELVIGLETHIEVLSESKLFSGASADYNPTVAPNTQVSMIDVAMPGMLPVINKYIEPFIAIGPQFSWNIGDSDVTLKSVRDMINESGNANIDQIINKIPNIDDPLKVYRLKDSNISLNLGLGVILFDHLQIHANYNLSFNNTAEIIENGVSIPGIIEIGKSISELKTNTWQISLAYIF